MNFDEEITSLSIIDHGRCCIKSKLLHGNSLNASLIHLHSICYHGKGIFIFENLADHPMLTFNHNLISSKLVVECWGWKSVYIPIWVQKHEFSSPMGTLYFRLAYQRKTQAFKFIGGTVRLASSCSKAGMSLWASSAVTHSLIDQALQKRGGILRNRRSLAINQNYLRRFSCQLGPDLS